MFHSLALFLFFDFIAGYFWSCGGGGLGLLRLITC